MITPRLQCIIDNIKGDTIADIGTDHAYIPIELMLNNKISKAIAGDIKEGPVRIARANAEKHGVADKIEIRLGSGLNVIQENEVDTIVIAGMGGQLICDILNENENIAKSAKNLVLQPMNSQNDLRKFLIFNGYIITHEDLAVEEFKIYNIIVCKKGHMEPFKSDFEYHIPKYLYSNRYFNELYKKKKREFTKIVAGLAKKSAKTDDDWVKLKQYEKLLGDVRGLGTQGTLSP